MAGLLGWLPGRNGPGAESSRIEDDTIVAMRFFDDTPPLRASVLAWTFRFNDVLDHEKLHDAVTRLLNIPSWRQLGARLRMSSNGKLELHIPNRCTVARPSFRFSHVATGTSLEDHPLACRLPKTSETASMYPGASEFRLFAARSNAPAVIEDFINSDEPQLSIHVTAFSDATLIGLSMPHTVTDVMGLSVLMNAISLMLAGRDGEVPALRDPSNDPLENIGTAKDSAAYERHALADWRISGLAGLRFMFNFLWDKFWYPEMETRIAYLPADFMLKLRAQAEQDVFNGTSDKPPFVSNSDILSGWITSLIQATDVTPRPAIIMNVLNVRGRLTDPSEVFIQNLAFNTIALLSAKDVSASSLGYMAAKVRQALTQQTTEAQMRAIVKESRSSYAATGYAPLFGDAAARLIIVSNWDKAKLFDAIDFSPAVVRSRYEKKTSVSSGRLVYHHAQSLKDVMEARHFFNIIGKESDGGFWISGNLMSETWRRMEDALGLKQEENV